MVQPAYYLSLAEASKMLAARQLSPLELLDECLHRIERFDPDLHSVVTLTAERAQERARAMESELMARRYRGVLHGIPYGLKDVISTAGIPTTAGSPAFETCVPKTDATVEQLLADAGGVLIGKLATHELTYGGVSLDLPWPPTRNPWHTDHDSGGSSAGSGAAVAAGFCTLALGTDTGGSIRNPAALCGIVGMKPTLGLVSRFGIVMNSQSLDVCGPLARTVEDCALVLELIAKHDPLDWASTTESVNRRYRESLDAGIKGIRIGLVRHFYECDLVAAEEVHKAMDAAVAILREMGAEVKTVLLPPLRDFADCKVKIQLPEIYTVHRERLEKRPHDFGKKVLNRVLPGANVTASDYLRAQEERRRLTRSTVAAMEGIDVLLTAGPGPAPLISDVAGETQLNKLEITVPFSLTGMPAISICNGFSEAGLPLSMQIAGRHFSEGSVLRVAHAYERATTWHERHPIP